ncbi:MAG: hypothetical protein SAK29_09540 [Scytonema sp. PMC 1069.18]|nr:hypothetical protein [Scytonema sp. PMC 1069.18]MEC4882674.1 hypothetical protein [Scytonema sp. PMC 1070.18]
MLVSQLLLTEQYCPTPNCVRGFRLGEGVGAIAPVDIHALTYV